MRTLVRAWLMITIVDGLYASALTMFAYKSTFSRLWQGVASTLLGASALQGGTRTVLIGLLMHAGVALAWTIVFMMLVMALPWLRRVITSWSAIMAVAAVYGPFIWLVMSFVVIPRLTGRPPTINSRWWVQLLSHIPFVALPIVAMIGRGLDAPARFRDRPIASVA